MIKESREIEDCHAHACVRWEESNKKDNEREKSARGSETKRNVDRRRGKSTVRERRIEKKERESERKNERQKEKERWQTRRHAQPSVSRRLAICVVFYDNYKYGRKALCLEQLVRLFETLPFLATVQRRLFRLQKVDDLLHANIPARSFYADHSLFVGSWRQGREGRRGRYTGRLVDKKFTTFRAVVG